MLYIVNVSGGLTSYEALRRTVERHSIEQTRAVFADTRKEDADLYRFLDDTERLTGVSITRLADGRTPWEVCRAERVITMQQMAPCSRILKHEVIDRWVTETFGEKPKTLVFGFDWSEPHRAERIARRLAPTPTWCPLAEPPYVTKHDIAAALRALGVQPPQMYAQGFSHNNCGGKCVRAGISHFVHLYRVRPADYAEMEHEEQAIRVYLDKDISVLKDRRGGETKPLTLKALREGIEAGEQYESDLWGGCGCFIE